MGITPNQIKEALTPLRDCRYIASQSVTHYEKLEVLQITNVFKELVSAHGYERAKKAVEIFSTGKNRNNSINNKASYLKKTILSIIKEMELLEANDALINDADYLISKFDHYRYSLDYVRSQATWENNDYPPKSAIFKADAFSKNEAMLIWLRDEKGLSAEQVDLLRERWNALEREELEALEFTDTLSSSDDSKSVDTDLDEEDD